jgi:cytochrome P450
MTGAVADSVGRSGLPPQQEFDFLSSDTSEDPHPLLHRMRAEDPVHWSRQLNAWVVTRHADILRALKDPRLTATGIVGQLDLLPDEQRRLLEPLRTSVAMWMGATNHDDHLRMQRVIKPYFSPGIMEDLRPRAQAITDELIDAFSERGRCDVVGELARPLPARVIADMLGVPDKDRDLLPRWSRDIAAVFGPPDPALLLQSQRSIVEMSEYMRPIIAARRDDPKDDLISVLVAAHEQGLVRSEEEILANCVLLLFAGHETTVGLISKGLFLLLTHPAQLELLHARPELLPGAIEEMLRYDGPAPFSTRLAAAPLELDGKMIEAHQLVFLVLAAGNRDPAQTADPDRFDITRTGVRHLAFGQGTFYCLGAALARMEAQVCFSTLVRRLGELRLHPAGASWEPQTMFSRGLVALPITFPARN